MVLIVPATGGDVIPGDVPAFNDLLDLRTAVVENVKSTEIVGVFPRLVAQTEARFNRVLRTSRQIEEVTLALIDGRAPLPDNFIEVVSLHNAAGCEFVQQSPQMVRERPHSRYYAIEAGEVMGPLSAGDVTLTYYEKVTPLTDLTQSNWLLAHYPDVYLFGVSFEAAKHLRDGELAQINQQLMEAALAEVSGDDTRRRYSRARVRLSGVTP